MRNIGLLLLITCCFATFAAAQSSQDKELVDRYLKAGPAPCCDRPEPYSEEVASKPYLALLLADALNNPTPAIQKKQTGIIWMLGRMGNPDVFQNLIDVYDKGRLTGFRIRLMTSLGSCLTEATLDQYLDVVMNDQEILVWFEKTIGKSCGIDRVCWQAFLKSEELENFKDHCRQLSQPILG